MALNLERDNVGIVDGSDSYENKVAIGGKIEAGLAFKETNGFIETELVPGLIHALGARATFTLVQFSGIKQHEKDYKPGSGGVAGSGLTHYNIEQEPTRLSEGMSTRAFNFRDRVESLDGNGQLFLALQDMNMDNFLAKLDKASKVGKDQKRHRVLIIFADEEWTARNWTMPLEAEKRLWNPSPPKTPKTTKRTRSSSAPTETPTYTRTLLRTSCATADPSTTRRSTSTNSTLKSRRRLAPSSATLKTCDKLGLCQMADVEKFQLENHFYKFNNTYSGNIK